MADNTILCYELPRSRAGETDNKVLLPYPFHLLDVAPPTNASGMNHNGKGINSNTPSHEENREYFYKYPYTPMPPEPHGYIKVNKYDPY